MSAPGFDRLRQQLAPVGGPAFPVRLPDPDGGADRQFIGMTLRDVIASHALAGLLAAPHVQWEPDAVARTSYAFADAMIRARGDAA